MGKGLLAWWRGRIVARGLAGVALFAVPVAVAALIGFGTSLSEVAGGLSAVTNGPDAVPASDQTSAPAKLNRAVVALASKHTTAASENSVGSRGGSTPGISETGTSGGSGGSTGTSGGSGGGSDTGSSSTPSISSPAAPQVNLPGGGGGTGSPVNTVNGSVNQLLDGVNNTVNGLLGN